ncbi:unnamed protein product [Mytilus edulis]|uniref:Mab-21-like HhH/H2TH-like domain-containing protein n=1 Tax=Mytilus edulis TaxID=6550 RepID=A0A8S3RYZ3_MYTED|nr:unnamed protein product [Mytilus edulis]
MTETACCVMNGFPVFEDASKANKYRFSLLIVRESNAPVGYVKLQLVFGGVPLTSNDWHFLYDFEKYQCLETDRFGRIVLSDNIRTNLSVFSRPKNKPAFKCQKHYGLIDAVISYRCTTWPIMAHEWLSRKRCYGWPTLDNIEELKLLGFFLVRKGHSLSNEIDLEWRISFTLQERKLMFDITDVQHKCYIVLKMFNRDMINLDCITSYHWKTCLFYVIEENDSNVWKQKLLFNCIQMCIRQMLKWVKCGFCPNYFIPGENLFDGKLTASLRLIVENLLEQILDVGFECFLYVKSNNLCDFARSRESVKLTDQLQVNSQIYFKGALYVTNMTVIIDTLSFFNHSVLGCAYYQHKEHIESFIKLLFMTLEDIIHNGTITGHTIEDTALSLSSLSPYIYTCLASIISAIAIQSQDTNLRDFLLFGSHIYFMKGGLHGRLKFISVLYAIGLYNECEWCLDQLDEGYIMTNPSFCFCRYIQRDLDVSHEIIINASELQVSTCVSFLPIELPITPDALKYEIFRYVGISLTETERTSKAFSWQYRAVVDSNIYFCLLKYLIKRNLKKIDASHAALYDILHLLNGPNVKHVDVAWNLLAWCLCSERYTSLALRYLTFSWKEMNSLNLCYTILEEELKRKQYQFNSAKLHALVILYNIWFAKIHCSKHFAFIVFLKVTITYTNVVNPKYLHIVQNNVRD